MKLRELTRLGMATTAGRFVWSAAQRWNALPAGGRARLQALLRKSGGRPARLSRAERQEFGELVRKLELPALVRGAAIDAAPPRGRLRRRR
jgi:hypothetical protein